MFFSWVIYVFSAKNDEKCVCGFHFNSKQTATRHTALKSDRKEPAENKQ